MDKLALYKFLQSGNVKDYEKSDEMYLVWIYPYGIGEFDNLIAPSFKDDGGIEMYLQDGCVCIDLAAADIGLCAEELEEVFKDE